MLSTDQIILKRYKGTKHILTPKRIKQRSIRTGFVAAELLWGNGMFGNRYMVGVSVAVYDPDEDGPDLSPRLSNSFSGDSLPDLKELADDYVNRLVTSLRWCPECGWVILAVTMRPFCPTCGGDVMESRPSYD